MDANAQLVALVWALSRVLIWAFVMVGHIVMRSGPRPWPSETDPGSWAGVESYWLNPWTLYDSAHYINIAKTAYPATDQWRSVFFPLYPFLMRVLSGGSTNDDVLALTGIIISNVAFLGALWLLFCLTRDEWGEAVARRAVWLEAFFPMAAFSGAVYTESLFLLLSIGFFWMARQKKWWLSGLCGFLAGLTRNSGPILCLALLLDRPKEPLTFREKANKALCAIAPLLGFIAVQILLRWSYGSQMNSTSAQSLFGRALTFPLKTVWLDIESLPSLEAWLNFVTVPSLLGVFTTFGLIWYYRKRFSPGKLVYVGAILLLSLTLAWQGKPHTLSTLRYMFGAFPAIQLIALFSTEKLSSPRVTLYLATAGILLLFIHSYLIGYKNFMG